MAGRRGSSSGLEAFRRVDRATFVPQWHQMRKATAAWPAVTSRGQDRTTPGAPGL